MRYVISNSVSVTRQLILNLGGHCRFYMSSGDAPSPSQTWAFPRHWAHIPLIFMLLLSSLATQIGWCQTGMEHRDPEGRAKPDHALMDVIIIVWPQSVSSGRIGIAYKQRVAHNKVQADIARLANALGGSASLIDIDDQSVHPDDLEHFPVNTSAMCTLRNCSLMSESAPNLRPFLTAFQSQSHVEVIFAIPDLPAYTGVVSYDSPALSITLIKEEGDYRYDADIRDHKNSLPQLPTTHASQAGSPLPSPPSGSVSGRQTERKNTASGTNGLWIVVGAALICGIAALVKVFRRSPSPLAPQQGNSGSK